MIYILLVLVLLMVVYIIHLDMKLGRAIRLIHQVKGRLSMPPDINRLLDQWDKLGEDE